MLNLEKGLTIWYYTYSFTQLWTVNLVRVGRQQP